MTGPGVQCVSLTFISFHATGNLSLRNRRLVQILVFDNCNSNCLLSAFVHEDAAFGDGEQGIQIVIFTYRASILRWVT
jgi:hypothetical protein